ncbi:MAG: aldo/keto reductase [Burkholderiales bacterium]|nr:aldo/keto reductase [Burkholderiales bacterium]
MRAKALDSGRRRALLGVGAGLTLGPLTALAAGTALVKRAIPATGERVPVVGLGTWQAFDVAATGPDHDAARAALTALLDGGGTVIDSSPMYGRAESVVGQLLATGGLRQRLFIATKVWTRGKAEGVAQMRESMARFGVEQLDLMQVHNLLDAASHLETLADWKREGRVRLLGITHYHAGAHRDLEAALVRTPVDVVQVNYSLAEPEAGQRLLGVCRDRGIAVIVNRPFAEGAMFARVRGSAVPAWAQQELGCASWAQFFLKWILGDAAVTVAIPGTRNARHVVDNLGAARGAMPDARQRERMRLGFAAL